MNCLPKEKLVKKGEKDIRKQQINGIINWNVFSINGKIPVMNN